MKIYIYALLDENKRVRYVGISKSVKTRMYGHWSPKPEDQSERANWIRELKANDKEPLVEILEETTDKKCSKREAWWIAEMKRRGESLFNVRKESIYHDNGGRSLLPASQKRVRLTIFVNQATADKIAAIASTSWQSPGAVVDAAMEHVEIKEIL